MTDSERQTTPVRKGHELDLDSLQSYLRIHLSEAVQPLSIKQFKVFLLCFTLSFAHRLSGGSIESDFLADRCARGEVCAAQETSWEDFALRTYGELLETRRIFDC